MMTWSLRRQLRPYGTRRFHQQNLHGHQSWSLAVTVALLTFTHQCNLCLMFLSIGNCAICMQICVHAPETASIDHPCSASASQVDHKTAVNDHNVSRTPCSKGIPMEAGGCRHTVAGRHGNHCVCRQCCKCIKGIISEHFNKSYFCYTLLASSQLYPIVQISQCAQPI